MEKKSKKINSLPVHLPENFHADDILSQEKKMNVTKRTNMKAAMYHILDTLYDMSQTRKWRDKFEEKGGYPIKADIMNRLLGKRYTEAIKILENHGVIERTTEYQEGKQSKLMRLTGPYAAARTKIREIPLQATIREKLLKEKEVREDKNQLALNKILFITKWFDPARLTVDEKNVHGFIEFYRSELLSRIPKKLPKSKTMEEIESRINHRVNSMIETMENLRKGEMRLTKTGKDHRLHSILSNTKKELRTLYLYDGKPLVSIDLKSSQPYFLTHLFNPKYWEENKAIILDLLSTSITPDLLSQLSSLLMFGAFGDIQDYYSTRKEGFPSITWNDDFYVFISNKAKAEGMSDVFPDRNTVKKKMMMILYDDGNYMEGDRGFLLFAKWFPREAKLIRFFKELSHNEKKKGTDPDEVTNFLPILLQRLESNLMLEKICKVISEELPDAPLLPVHDCIHTTAEFAEKVRMIMDREFTKIVSIKPGIKVDEYNHQKTLNELSILADEDMDEILKKESKIISPVPAKPPLLLNPPEKGNDKLIYGRYIDPNYIEGQDPNEVNIRLIDDTRD